MYLKKKHLASKKNKNIFFEKTSYSQTPYVALNVGREVGQASQDVPFQIGFAVVQAVIHFFIGVDEYNPLIEEQ